MRSTFIAAALVACVSLSAPALAQLTLPSGITFPPPATPVPVPPDASGLSSVAHTHQNPVVHHAHHKKKHVDHKKKAVEKEDAAPQPQEEAAKPAENPVEPMTDISGSPAPKTPDQNLVVKGEKSMKADPVLPVTGNAVAPPAAIAPTTPPMMSAPVVPVPPAAAVPPAKTQQNLVVPGANVPNTGG